MMKARNRAPLFCGAILIFTFTHWPWNHMKPSCTHMREGGNSYCIGVFETDAKGVLGKCNIVVVVSPNFAMVISLPSWRTVDGDLPAFQHEGNHPFCDSPHNFHFHFHFKNSTKWRSLFRRGFQGSLRLFAVASELYQASNLFLVAFLTLATFPNVLWLVRKNPKGVCWAVLSFWRMTSVIASHSTIWKSSSLAEGWSFLWIRVKAFADAEGRFGTLQAFSALELSKLDKFYSSLDVYQITVRLTICREFQKSELDVLERLGIIMFSSNE